LKVRAGIWEQEKKTAKNDRFLETENGVYAFGPQNTIISSRGTGVGWTLELFGK
jgi:hypothetical protein